MSRLVRVLLVAVVTACLAAMTLAATTTAATAAPRKLTKASLKSAPVPALCGHKPGRLSKGQLRGIAPGAGFVRLGTKRQIALGKLVKGGRRNAVATVHCSGGGVDYDTYLLFYRPGARGPKLRAKVRLDTVTGWGREAVRTIKIRKRAVRVGWISGRPDEPLCCGTLWVTASYKLKGKRAKRTSLKKVTEAATARKFLAAINARNAKAARKYAPAAVVARAMSETRSSPRMRLTSCYRFPEQTLRERACSSEFTSGSLRGTYALGMVLRHRAKGTWRVASAMRPE